MPRLCEICDGLDLEDLFDPELDHRRTTFIELDVVENVLERSESCNLCSFIAGHLHRDSDRRRTVRMYSGRRRSNWVLMSAGYASSYAEMLQDQPKYHKRLYGDGALECDVYVAEQEPEEGRARNRGRLVATLVLMDDCKMPRQHRQFRERELDSDGPDFSILRSWLSSCLTEHAELCESPPGLAPTPPSFFRVIDVGRRSVVEAPSDCQYAALSYVWGGSQTVARQEDLSALPWCLPHPPQLSKVVEDGITICRKLGIQYLWTDALCIVQVPSTNKDKTQQIAEMDKIYRSAMLTICATSSTKATQGMLGSGLRRVRQSIVKFKGNLYTEPQRRFERAVDNDVWNWRGWTYQERMLSRRKLFISEEQTFWNCQCDCWMESTIAEPLGDGTIGLLQIPKRTWTTYPEMEQGLKHTPGLVGVIPYGQEDDLLSTWTSVVSQYTGRKLGDSADGLNAITGVLNVLTQMRQPKVTHFLWGIPTCHFDIGLLWMPRTGNERGKVTGLPSWSWAAWFGGGGLGVQWDGADFFVTSSIRPAVDWFTLRSDGSSSPLPWIENRSPRAQSVCGISASDENDMSPRVSPECVHIDSFYLHFRTTQAKFKVGRKLAWKDKLHDWTYWLPDHAHHFVADAIPNYPYELLDQKDLRIGHVVLPDQSEGGVPRATFVFLSYSRDFSAEIEEYSNVNLRTGEDSDWPIVNCMMIETDPLNGFSVRNAVGKVTVEAWLAAKPSAKWVVLG